MGRQQKPGPDLEELAELEEQEIPGEYVVRRYLVTHERTGRGLPRRPREPGGGPRRRKPGQHREE